MTSGQRRSVPGYFQNREQSDFASRLVIVSEHRENPVIPAGDKRHPFIFDVNASIGKTSLTGRLHQVAVEHEYLPVCMDWSADGVIGRKIFNHHKVVPRHSAAPGKGSPRCEIVPC